MRTALDAHAAPRTCRWVKELELMLHTKEKAEIRASRLRSPCCNFDLVCAQRRSALSAFNTSPRPSCRSSCKRCARGIGVR